MILQRLIFELLRLDRNSVVCRYGYGFTFKALIVLVWLLLNAKGLTLHYYIIHSWDGKKEILEFTATSLWSTSCFTIIEVKQGWAWSVLRNRFWNTMSFKPGFAVDVMDKELFNREPRSIFSWVRFLHLRANSFVKGINPTFHLNKIISK